MPKKSEKKTAQKKEVDLLWVQKYLRDGVYPPGLNFTEKRMVRKRAERFCFWKDELHYLGTPTDQGLGKKSRKVLLTKQERWEKVGECHIDSEGNHLGLERTAENITAKYHWNGIYKFIKQYIRQCAVCLERHPKLLGKTKKAKDDSDVSMEDETDSGGEEKEESSPPSGTVVDLRLLGAFPLADSVRYVLVSMETQCSWIEAFVLDCVSPDTLAASLLQLVSRYGQIGSVTQSVENQDLSAVMHGALQSLKEGYDTHVGFNPKGSSDTAGGTLNKAAALIKEFIEKNPNNWPEKLDFCLLPLRMTAQKRNASAGVDKSASDSSVSIEEEMNKAAEALMSVHKAQVATTQTPAAVQQSSLTLTSAQAHSESVSEAEGVGIVTRSRTGRSKPKALDEENYEVPAAIKRKVSLTAVDSPGRKKIKIEVVTPQPSVIDIARETAPGAGEPQPMSTPASPVPVKKTVELDEYYRAIKQYVTTGTFPKDSSASFRSLIRVQASSYVWKDEVMYHQVGPNKELKQIVMTKDERVQLLAQTHVSNNTKSEMIQALENQHWKGKFIDIDAFLLACPHCETSKHAGEAKQLEYDRHDTYQEINNYIVYDVFSDDAASSRLEYIKRQIKNFKVENDELVHYMCNKRQRVVTSAADRQKLVADAHLRRGFHSDSTVTFQRLADQYFWFGLKYDVKIYVTYCCTSENKHMLDRFFYFRGYFMKQKVAADDENAQTVETTVESTIEEKQEVTSPGRGVATSGPDSGAGGSSQKSSVFVSSMKLHTDKPQSVPETSQEGQSDLPTVLTEAGDEGQQILLAADGTPVENNSEVPTTILVRVTNDGQTFIVHEDGSEQQIVKLEDGTEIVQTTGKSDDVTSAAVKSILQDPAVSTLIAVSEGGGASEAAITYETSEAPATTQTGDSESTVDAGTSSETIIEEGEDSDSWIYGSEDDDDETDEGQQKQVMTMYVAGNGQAKVVTPRQHFKCSQCNKIFYGPLKFKMHMYKHTGQKPFPCNLCHKKYTNKKSLVMHQKTHTGELPYLCSLCGRRCPSKISLKSHLKCHDGNGGGLPAKCDVCDRVFTRRHLMERHKLHKHLNVQTEFTCSECNKVFSHQRSLKRHFMSAHLNIKNHVCGLCGKSFYRKEYLTGHLIQHGGAAAEGLTPRKQRPSTFKPRPSVFNNTVYRSRQGKEGHTEREEYEEEQDSQAEEGVQRIILTQDENGQLRVVDMATEREVKKMLEARGLSRGEAGETMVVHIEEPSGEPQVVHVEHTEEQVVEVPIGEHSYVEYQQVDEKAQEYIVGETESSSVHGTQFIYTATSDDGSLQGNQELVYGQPAVQYEVECVGAVEVDDAEALSAINLLAQASAQQYQQASGQQYENVISQI